MEAMSEHPRQKSATFSDRVASLVTTPQPKSIATGIKDFADKAKDALGDVADKAGDAAESVRDKVGDAAEAAVDKVDDMTGGKVPDAVKNAVDKIDGEIEQGDDAAE
jgi:ElaB/YqjD/DUF883 family membrane-anchored ribosome-binding protein